MNTAAVVSKEQMHLTLLHRTSIRLDGITQINRDLPKITQINRAQVSGIQPERRKRVKRM